MTPRRTLSCTAQFVARHARQTPDAVAVVEAGVRISYAAFAADLLRYAAALQRVPVQSGMLVGVETMNRYLHLQLLLACEIIGATTLSLLATEVTAYNPLVRGCDVLLATGCQIGGDLPTTVVMTADWLGDAARFVVQSTDLTLLDRTIPGCTIVRIARSSGTTAGPKVIAMSLAKQQLIVARNAEWVARDLAPRQEFLCIYHLTVRSVYHRVLGCLQHGGTIHFALEGEALDLIAAGAVNGVIFLVGDAERLVRDARPPAPGHSLIVWAIGSAASPALRRLIRERLNATFRSYYSSNETGRVACVDDDNVGALCPGVAVRIVDEAGQDKKLGENGYILVKTETMVDGYRDDPALTASRFVDGWFHTRDVGYMPAADRLVVLGRGDDILNVGGVKLSPGPIEAQIKAIDGITDAALLAIDGADRATGLLVAVETATGDLPPDFAARLNPVMAPTMTAFKLLVTRQFPRTDTGKVKRQDLLAIYRQVQTRSGRT